MISFFYKPFDGESQIATTNGFALHDTNTWNAEDATNILCNHIWSPHIWQNGVRRGDLWISCDMLALDFDSGEMTLSKAYDEFGDYWHIIGTTRNHMKSKKGEEPVERFRVLLTLPQPVTNKELYKEFYRTVSYNLPIDRACGDVARAFYPCAEIVSTNLLTDGHVPQNYPISKFFNNRRVKQNNIDTPKKYGYRSYAPHILRHGITADARWGRNQQTFYMANYFKESDFTEEEAVARIRDLIKDWQGFTERELAQAVHSAFSGRY